MKLIVATVSRSDFGIMSNLISLLKKDKNLSVSTLVTGEHFTSKMGNTFKEIKKKFYIDKRIKLEEYSSEPNSIIKKSSELITKFSNYIKNNKPDLILLLGDKYEVLMIAYCAFIFRIPIAHIHGGEKTSGSLDDTFRHQISKMADLHFVERLEYKKRLIQLGEDSRKISIVGSLSRENLSKLSFISKKEIEKKFSIKFFEKNIIFTYHPETIKNVTKKKLAQIFDIINLYPDIKFIITSPNLDPGSDNIRNIIMKKKKLKNVNYIKSFGQEYYFSVLKLVDGIIGNSSSGLIEVPFMKKFTINIGSRQNGRYLEDTVINCNNDIENIVKSIKFAYSKKFQKVLQNFKSLDNLNASKKILKKITNFDSKNYSYKMFNDIDFINK